MITIFKLLKKSNLSKLNILDDLDKLNEGINNCKKIINDDASTNPQEILNHQLIQEVFLHY